MQCISLAVSKYSPPTGLLTLYSILTCLLSFKLNSVSQTSCKWVELYACLAPVTDFIFIPTAFRTRDLQGVSVEDVIVRVFVACRVWVFIEVKSRERDM